MIRTFAHWKPSRNVDSVGTLKQILAGNSCIIREYGRCQHYRTHVQEYKSSGSCPGSITHDSPENLVKIEKSIHSCIIFGCSIVLVGLRLCSMVVFSWGTPQDEIK